jgi:hypothetical protein
MKFDIKEVLVSGDRVVVRGEVTGTPAGELFGVPHIAQIIVDKGDELNSRWRMRSRSHYAPAHRQGSYPAGYFAANVL